LRLSLTRTNTDLLFRWPSNVVSHLQMNTNLTSTNWTSLGSTGNQLIVSPGSGHGFYRLASP
jgi:hypothetical protein